MQVNFAEIVMNSLLNSLALKASS